MGSSSTKNKQQYQQIFDPAAFNLEGTIYLYYGVENYFPTTDIYNVFWKKYNTFQKTKWDGGIAYFNTAANLLGWVRVLQKEMSDEIEKQRIEEAGETVRFTVQTIIDQHKQQNQPEPAHSDGEKCHG